MAQQQKRTSVVIADDHPLYAQALARVVKQRPDLELVGQFERGREALEGVRDLRPDVALVDVRMPELDGIQLANAVARDELSTRVLLISGEGAAPNAYEAIGAGAAGYISKLAKPDEIGDAIQTVARGGTILSGEVQTALAGEVRQRSATERGGPSLSPREREILGMIAEGESAPGIANRLHLAPTTVRTHLQHLYEKLGVSDRAAAVATAMRLGLVE
jgi:two-component system, NarL family, nitrate/nitrite response regulator NarL